MPPKWLYSEKSMEDAMEAVRNGMNIFSAGKLYGVPRSTLRNKIKGISPISRKMGPPSVLSSSEEEILVRWVIGVGKVGFPFTKEMLLDSVQELVKKLQKSTPFNEGRPGRHWYEAFMKRHPEILETAAQNLTRSRSTANEQSIRNWFKQIQDYLEENRLLSVFEDPFRIYNCDETAFCLSLEEDRILVKNESKLVHNVVPNDDQERITVLVTASASGVLAPPMLIFKSQRIPGTVTKRVPKTWGIGRSDSGWMTGGTFYEYIVHIFYPWAVEKNIQFPIIMFMDGNTSHMTLALSEFCEEKNIILVCLHPNATHLLQPLNVSVFHPLEQHWKTALLNWKTSNHYKKFRKEDFCPLVKDVLHHGTLPSAVKSGFRKCGLLPFSPDAIDYSKLVTAETQNISANDRVTDEDVSCHLTFLERCIGVDRLTEFNRAYRRDKWDGKVEDCSLFQVWKDIKKRTSKTIDNEEPGGAVDNCEGNLR